MPHAVYTTQYDKMTRQPIPSLILELGLPTTLSMLVTNLYNIADTWFVGQINTSASGATGVVFGLMAILQAFGFMFGQGGGSHVSRQLGARRRRRACRYSATSFAAALITGIVMGALGLLLLDPLCRLLGSTDTILPYAHTYAACILLAAPAMVTSCVMNNILRYEGHAAYAMVGLVSGGILNIFGDALLMWGLHLGILGAGLSTMISQYISAAVLLAPFLRGQTQTSLAPRWLPLFPAPEPPAVPAPGEQADDVAHDADFDTPAGARLAATVLVGIVLTGLPSLVRQGLGSVSTMLLNSMAGRYGGDAAIAAMSIVARVCNFLFCVALGIGQGFQPVSGFNYGAGRYSRLRSAFFFTLGLGSLLMALFAAAGYLFAAPVVALLRDDPEVIAIGVKAMHMQCLALITIPLTLCGNMLFQSIGLSGRATLLAAMRSGACFIPLLLVFTHFWGLGGVIIAQPAADVLAAVVATPFTVQFLRSLPPDRVLE